MCTALFITLCLICILWFGQIIEDGYNTFITDVLFLIWLIILTIFVGYNLL